MRVGIYQLIIELAPSMLYSLDNIYRRYGNRVPAELYEKVFEGNIKAETYNDIFDVFNIRHPKGYKGRDMAGGDVIEIFKDDSTIEYVYCDSIGFKKIDFEKEKVMTVVLNHNYDCIHEERENVSVFFISKSGLEQIKCRTFEISRCKYSETQLGYRIRCKTNDGKNLKFDFLERPSIILSNCIETFPKQLLYADEKKTQYTAHDKENLGIVCTWLVRKGYEFENLYGGCTG